MLKTEKLTLFNIDQFNAIYDKSYNSLECSKSFFDYYDKEGFLIKHYLRKQVKLIKSDNNYIGYIWHEWPVSKDEQCEIFAFKIINEYTDCINKDFFSKDLKLESYKMCIDNDTSMLKIINKTNCICNEETYIMKFSANYCEINYAVNDLKFEMFVKNRDEKARSIVQNEIFKKPGRIDITPDDILYEENEDYYLDDFSVFIKKNEFIAGYGQIILSDNKYTIVNLGIVPQYRGLGYSKLLVKYLVDLCHKRSIDDIYIKVEKSNIAAYSLYRRMGFEIIKTYSYWNC